MKICSLVISFFSFLVGPSTKSEIILKKVTKSSKDSIVMLNSIANLNGLRNNEDTRRHIFECAYEHLSEEESIRNEDVLRVDDNTPVRWNPESHKNLSSVNLSSLLWGPYVRNLKLFQL